MEKIAPKSATKVQTKAAGKNYSFLWKSLRKGHPFMTFTWRGRGVRLRWTHVDVEEGVSSCGHSHIKLKLESCDTILSSSHEKKLATFLAEFRPWKE